MTSPEDSTFPPQPQEPDRSPQPPHRTVLLNESIELLNPQPGACMIDCTLGAGGHSAAIIPRLAPHGRLIGLDVDPQALEIARARLQPIAAASQVRLDLLQYNFRELGAALAEASDPSSQAPRGILADLGVSSMQFDTPERGFSFRFDEPLDMRMDPRQSQTAADILRTFREEEIADILYQYGEEHKSRRIARAIVEQRRSQPIETTGQLEELVRRALRIKGWRHTHPATKTFQALRIAVNQELDALKEFLDAAPEALAPDGVLAIITFHSLEDREVKQRFKALAATGRFRQIVKFVSPTEAEMQENPRSRSAKLRALKRISETERTES